MFFKGKEHTFVIYNGRVTSPEWVFRKFKLTRGWALTLAAPAVVATKHNMDEDQPAARLVLSDGTERKLANASINGSTVELAEL